MANSLPRGERQAAGQCSLLAACGRLPAARRNYTTPNGRAQRDRRAHRVSVQIHQSSVSTWHEPLVKFIAYRVGDCYVAMKGQRRVMRGRATPPTRAMTNPDR